MFNFLISLIEIKVETQIHCAMQHHFSFRVQYFHVIAIGLDFNTFHFFDLLCAWSLRGPRISWLMTIITLGKTRACQRT